MKNKLISLTSLTALLTYALIIIGGATRVTESGMACPDWPMCYGELFPFSHGGIFVSEFGSFNQWQVGLEWGHRFLASIVGGLMLVLGVATLYSGSRKAKIAAVCAMVLIAIQALLGGLTVLQANANWSVALHLGFAMLFFVNLIVLRKLLGQVSKVTKVKTTTTAKVTAWGFSLMVFVTMIIGAMVSSSYAGGVCGGLFSCLGNWHPVANFEQHLHMGHRYLALLAVPLMLAALTYFSRGNKDLRKSARGLWVLYSGQLILGIATLYSFAYYPSGYQHLSIAHLAWGTLLFMASVGLLSKLHLGLEGAFHSRKKWW